MEYFWYILAAAGAGIGTGLAGLSAATVMVPILIVLCPSFQGEAGAYQATAIALASDILGSAVTSAIYARNKRIDLRHGWLLMACILAMCTVGSVVAWIAGHVVLGSFSLILTFCIGIRFLVRPDTHRKNTLSREAKLDGKGIAVSLFFGLTIGFGTGFVGSGGGMMMLIVLTAFLGYELKTAVGTSTFIMTFTALIASVSHILIDPDIVLLRWDALLICIVTATLFSLLSAQFANRVKTKTVGYVTGGVLTVLGGAMLCLHYLPEATVRAIPACLGWFLGFFAVAATLLLLIRRFCRVPAELFRKLLHLAAILSILVLVRAAAAWEVAAICALLFIAIVYPALGLLESFQGYSALLTERRPGEIKKSLVLLFAMEAAMIALCWGGFGQPYIAVTGILAWGVGDGAAALVGKRFGRHRNHLPLADGHKTWEGTAAMLVASFAVTFCALAGFGVFPVGKSLLAAAIVAPLAAWMEMITHNGYDTVTVPLLNCAALLLIWWL